MPETQALDMYGIANCDQVRRARDWLKTRAIPVVFHDFKTEPPTRALVLAWLDQVSWQSLVNRRGTTWRELQPQARPTDLSSAVTALLASPTLIKRPVLSRNGIVLVGFDETAYSGLLG